MSYYSERTLEFQALVADEMFGTVIVHKLVPYRCIADPQVSEKEMTQSAFQMTRQARFDMWRDDFTASRMKLRDTITDVDGNQYEVVSFITDPKEPTVTLRCNRLQ